MQITLIELEALIKANKLVKINSPSGYVAITDTYRKSSPGVKIAFDDNSELLVANHHRIRYSNNWVFAKDLQINNIINSKRVINIKPLDYQDWVDFSVDAEHESYYHNGILHHNSGKSLIIGATCRYQVEVLQHRVLIVVPTISLTAQMKSDFADYFAHTGWNADEHCHLITAGIDKNIKKPIVISTFQSIYKLGSEWFNNFDCIIADEGHKVTADTIAGIFNKATAVKYKLSCTGTLHDMKCNVLQMIGLTGPVHEIAPTAALIKAGRLVPLKIKALVLDYPADICKAMNKADYDAEIKFVVTNQKRINFVAKLAAQCQGATLVLFRFVDLQGIPLFNRIKELVGDTRPVHFIDGSVTGVDREDIRLSANVDDNTIICASFPTMSMGVNVPAIENIIFAHPTKSKITSLQSIGRGLRLKDGKTSCQLFDISDNLQSGKHINMGMKHLGERLKIYTLTGFKFTIVHIPF